MALSDATTGFLDDRGRVNDQWYLNDGDALDPAADTTVLFTSVLGRGPLSESSLLEGLAPILGRLGGDVESLLSILDPTAVTLRADAASFAEQVDPDRCEARVLPFLLHLIGWSLRIDLTELQQRQLAKSATLLYQEKGTRPGVLNALRLILGYEAALVAFLTDCWTLGESQLGLDTYTGARADERDADGFAVLFDRVLSPREREVAQTIIDYMKPAHTHFAIQEVTA